MGLQEVQAENASLHAQVAAQAVELKRLNALLEKMYDRLESYMGVPSTTTAAEVPTGKVKATISRFEKGATSIAKQDFTGLATVPQPKKRWTGRKQTVTPTVQKAAVAEDKVPEKAEIQSGWVLNKSRKEVTKEVQVQNDVMDPLWSVSQIKVGELNSSTSGIAFVHPSEAKEILQRPKATVPQAILCATNVNDLGVGGDVTVTDCNQRPQTRFRYLFQTGTGNVTCDTTSIPKGGACTTKTLLGVVTIDKKHTCSKLYDSALRGSAARAIGDWLTVQKCKFTEVKPPKLTDEGYMRIVVRLPASMLDPFYDLSGRDGVVTGNYIEKDADKKFFAVIPLDNCNREKAMELAKYHGAECRGVMPVRNGNWGIRVKYEKYDAMAQKIRPDDFAKITGVVYEISALPSWMGEEALSEFLAPSNSVLEVKKVERTGFGVHERRTFYVKTCEPIAWTRKQGDTFVATCKVAEYRPKAKQQTATYRQAASQSAFPRLHPAKPISNDVEMETEGRNVRQRVATESVQASQQSERALVQQPPTASAPPQGLTLESLLLQLTTQISAVGAEITPLRADIQTLAGRVACLEGEDEDIDAQSDDGGESKGLGKGLGRRRNSALQARGILNKVEPKK